MALELLLCVLLVGLGSCKSDDSKKDSMGTVIGIDLGTTYSW